MRNLVCALFGLLILNGCSKGSVPAEKKRPISFYAPIINSAEQFDGAAQNLSSLKVLASAQKYEMRFAMFDNGKFYYEVGNLGTGQGEWKYRDGYINLFASRHFFDLDIDLRAASGADETLEMSFVDRFGGNVVGAKLVPPSVTPLKKLAMPVKEIL